MASARRRVFPPGSCARVATHAALKVIRKRKGLPTVSLEANTEPQEGYDTVPHPEYMASWRESPEQLVGRNETSRLIDEALQELNRGATGRFSCFATWRGFP